jgi:hypothetical protein
MVSQRHQDLPPQGIRQKFGVGITTGTLRDCTLEGCTGVKVGVRWPDGGITWICTKGLDAYRKGFRIL